MFLLCFYKLMCSISMSVLNAAVEEKKKDLEKMFKIMILCFLNIHSNDVEEL